MFLLIETYDEAIELAAWTGAIAAAAQVALYLLFRQSSNPAVSSTAGLAAHQVIAFFFMVLAFSVGGAGFWFGQVGAPKSQRGMMLDECPSARWLAAVLAGELVLWDIPCGLLIPQLRKVDSLLHHVAMALVAYTVLASIPSYYALYYLGAIELSSIPLQLNDYCRLNQAAVRGPHAMPFLAKLNEMNHLLTAVLFVGVRLISFTYVSFTGAMPDTLHALATLGTSEADQRRRVPLQVYVVTLTFFQALQLYWGWLHGKSFLKAQTKKAKE